MRYLVAVAALSAAISTPAMSAPSEAAAAVKPNWQVCLQSDDGGSAVCSQRGTKYNLNNESDVRLLLRHSVRVCAPQGHCLSENDIKDGLTDNVKTGGEMLRHLAPKKSKALKPGNIVCWADKNAIVDCTPRKLDYSLADPADLELLASHSLLVCTPNGDCYRERQFYRNTPATNPAK